MRWSLEEWMKHRGSSFRWNLVHKHNTIQYMILVNIKYFIFSEKLPYMFELGLILYNAYCMFLLNTKFFQVYEMCATLCNTCVVDIGVNIGIAKS